LIDEAVAVEECEHVRALLLREPAPGPLQRPLARLRRLRVAELVRPRAPDPERLTGRREACAWGERFGLADQPVSGGSSGVRGESPLKISEIFFEPR
jgi:hypothetical protein